MPLRATDPAGVHRRDHPACSSPSSTGTQSAVSTAKAKPGTVVTSPSLAGTGLLRGPSTTVTVVLCVCSIHTTRSSGSPRCRAKRVRLAATAAGSSPTWSPRLNESYGGADTPLAGGHHPTEGTHHFKVGNVDLVFVLDPNAVDRDPVRHDAVDAQLVGARGGRITSGPGAEDRIPGIGRVDPAGLSGCDGGLADPSRRRRDGAVRRRRTGGDHGDPDFVAEVVVDDGAEDDVGILVAASWTWAAIVDLEQTQIRTAGDGEQRPGRPPWRPRAAGS